MAQRKVPNHRKGNEALGAEPDELLTVKVSRLEAQIDSVNLLMMKAQIGILEKQNASVNLEMPVSIAKS